MNLSAKAIKELRSALHDHGFNNDHAKYGIEAVINDMPSGDGFGPPFSEIFSFAIKATREKYPDADDDTGILSG